jgi:hypothetical protein
VAAPTSLLTCPAGKKILGMGGWWSTSSAAVQTVLQVTGAGGGVYTTGIPAADTLNISITCATVS